MATTYIHSNQGKITITPADVRLEIVSTALIVVLGYAKVTYRMFRSVVGGGSLSDLEYSTDGGHGWNTISATDPGDSDYPSEFKNLEVNGRGNEFVLYWKAATDLGIEAAFDDVLIRLTPNDNGDPSSGDDGDAVSSSAFDIDFRPAAAQMLFPLDIFGEETQPEVVFAAPVAVISVNYHFKISVDKVNTFDGPDLQNFYSSTSWTKFEYDNAGTWTAFPSGGLPSSNAGARVRLKQGELSALSEDLWYVQVTLGIV